MKVQVLLAYVDSDGKLVTRAVELTPGNVGHLNRVIDSWTKK